MSRIYTCDYCGERLAEVVGGVRADLPFVTVANSTGADDAVFVFCVPWHAILWIASRHPGIEVDAAKTLVVSTGHEPPSPQEGVLG